MSESQLEQDIVDFDDAAPWGGDTMLVEIDYVDNRIWGRVPLSRISSVYDPFESPPWYDGQGVSRVGVATAICEGRLESAPYSVDRFGPDWTDRRHEERIAWLVLNPSKEPIEIEFSHPECVSFSVDDGNHRLASAIFRNDPEIAIQLGGYFNNSVKALGVICRKLQIIAASQDCSAAPSR
jgi:hypothetical protein